MRYLGLLLGVGVSCAGAAFFACSSGDGGAGPDDGGADGAADVASDGGVDTAPPDDDASKVNCTLDNGGDPVALCVQKLVLGALRKAAFSPDGGVLAGWDSNTGVPGQAHDLHDDVAYGAVVANYGTSSTRYGDNELTPALDVDLQQMVPLLKSELQAPPNEYSGELYLHLRDVAVGLRYLSRDPDADAIDALADAYGRQIMTHFLPIGPQPDAGAPPDAGDAGDAGLVAVGDGVLVQDTGTKDYAPADVATGALALMDMAARHAQDDPANAAKWADAAHASFDHVVLRAREPATKRFYRLLVPSAAVDHDDISPRAPAPQDLLTADAAATVALSLLRAQEMIDKNGAALARIAGYPFVDNAVGAIAAANAAPSLWDADKNGYMEGSSPSLGAVFTNKPSRANALMLGALHRANLLASVPQATQINPLRTLLTARQPVHAGFLTATGAQNAYYLEVSQAFDLASPDAGAAGDPQSYSSAATLAVCEGFNEQWYGLP